ncbi:LysR family transcriptional regulator [Yinghuangia soli]|uniref:LysR family transcriptional regulator n=1 Tax=Yinghuangia soli TaxID=2908204 RepID=A0AA41PY09_9ACTN|nr:LysR family transcriptional regulator [Yinghuangia soli]MCF2527271.1 LysR family transcriptional regulator [Yinghuangia soli]
MAGGIEIREIEAFLALAEELHFGRTGERLYISQSRVSQLLRALEHRVGARLVERTSRRVRLTPLGERFRTQLTPAYAALHSALDETRAAAGEVAGVLRLGFQGTANDQLMEAVAAFEARHPGSAAEIGEVPLNDPFGPLRRGEVDAAVVMLPAEEPDVAVGPVFSRQAQTLAVSVRHRFAGRDVIDAEELAACELITVAGPAPGYWRRANAPELTPSGRGIPCGPAVRTLQEGLSMAAADRGAMLLCRPTAEYHARRSLVFVPVTGLPESALALTWLRSGAAPSARVAAFARALRDATAADPASVGG